MAKTFPQGLICTKGVVVNVTTTNYVWCNVIIFKVVAPLKTNAAGRNWDRSLKKIRKKSSGGEEWSKIWQTAKLKQEIRRIKKQVFEINC